MQNEIKEYIQEHRNSRATALEGLCAEYLAYHNCDPADVELVETQRRTADGGAEVVWSIRRKETYGVGLVTELLTPHPIQHGNPK